MGGRGGLLMWMWVRMMMMRAVDIAVIDFVREPLSASELDACAEKKERERRRMSQ